ncbi:MAG: winged helix-turn-helix transcriptional regulator [Phycisphaerales bacterium]|nr:winged helix-turn-helix transcriptional regulator [Phycisphaerales bacterium]
MNRLTTITHALSDPTRIRLLAACLDRERCVCQLVELIDLSNASISKHLAMLKAGGLLESRREGRWVHYRTPPSPTPIVRDAIAFVRSYAMRTQQIVQDAERLAKIDAFDPCDLARMQREGCCCVPHSTIPHPHLDEHTYQ